MWLNPSNALFNLLGRHFDHPVIQLTEMSAYRFVRLGREAVVCRYKAVPQAHWPRKHYRYRRRHGRCKMGKPAPLLWLFQRKDRDAAGAVRLDQMRTKGKTMIRMISSTLAL